VSNEPILIGRRIG